jgi:hypothetical protein
MSAWEPDPIREQQWRERLTAACERLAAREDEIELLFAVIDDHVIAGDVEPLDGVHIRWVSKPGSGLPPAGGELRWYAFDPRIGPRASCLIHEHSGAEAELLDRLIIFDDHPDSGDYVAVLADPERGDLLSRPGAELYLHQRGATVPLALDFVEYVELQIQLLGIGGWLVAAAKLRDHGLPADSYTAQYIEPWLDGAYARRALATAQAVFPDADLSRFSQPF